MTPEPLPPIPTPPGTKWRIFRVNVLPALGFVAVLAVTVWLWGRNLANPLLMGTAEAPRLDITSPRDGRIGELLVSEFQNVNAGEVIAIVHAVDPDIMSNQLAVVRAEIEMIRADAGFDGGDRVRYSQFQLEWMLRRVDLALRRLALPVAEANFKRDAALHEEKILADAVFESSKLLVDQLQQGVAETTEALLVAERALSQFDPAFLRDESASVKAAIAEAEQRLRLAESELKPIVITAPISGCITKLATAPGAAVGANQPILTIANPTVDRIVGYIGQPLRIEPRVGMEVEVRSRGSTREVGKAQIVHVGPRVELFDAPLRVRGMGTAQQRGLPIVMNVPENMKLRPGEMVELTLGSTEVN